MLNLSWPQKPGGRISTRRPAVARYCLVLPACLLDFPHTFAGPDSISGTLTHRQAGALAGFIGPRRGAAARSNRVPVAVLTGQEVQGGNAEYPQGASPAAVSVLRSFLGQQSEKHGSKSYHSTSPGFSRHQLRPRALELPTGTAKAPPCTYQACTNQWLAQLTALSPCTHTGTDTGSEQQHSPSSQG